MVFDDGGCGYGAVPRILTTLEIPEPANPSSDDRFHTFSVGDPFYTTYINIGLWRDLESFDSAIGKYISKVKVEEKDGRRVQTVELEEFEFKLRERVVLKVIGSRGADLPPPDVS